MLARIMDNQVWFEAYLRDTSGKGGSVRFAHHLHPREAGCRYGDHPFGYRNGCRNGAHRYNHDLASADSSRGAGDVLCEFLGAGLVLRQLKCNEA